MIDQFNGLGSVGIAFVVGDGVRDNRVRGKVLGLLVNVFLNL